jgi:hypothetical protein
VKLRHRLVDPIVPLWSTVVLLVVLIVVTVIV